MPRIKSPRPKALVFLKRRSKRGGGLKMRSEFKKPTYPMIVFPVKYLLFHNLSIKSVFRSSVHLSAKTPRILLAKPLFFSCCKLKKTSNAKSTTSPSLHIKSASRVSSGNLWPTCCLATTHCAFASIHSSRFTRFPQSTQGSSPSSTRQRFRFSDGVGGGSVCVGGVPVGGLSVCGGRVCVGDVGVCVGGICCVGGGGAALTLTPSRLAVFGSMSKRDKYRDALNDGLVG